MIDSIPLRLPHLLFLMVTYDHGPKTKHKGLIGNISSFNPCSCCGNLWRLINSGSTIRSLLVRCWSRIFVNLAREIVKDCRNIDEDGDYRNTLPMKIGLENSRMLAYVLTLAGIINLLYIPYWQGPFLFGQLLLQSPAIFILMALVRHNRGR